MKRFIRLLIHTGLILLVTGCGFHLRGQSDVLSIEQQQKTGVYLSTTASGQFLAKRLTLAIKLAHFSVVDDPELADYQLIITDVKSSQKAIGFDELGRNNEFEVSLLVSYLILPKRELESAVEAQSAVESIDQEDLVESFRHHHKLQRSLYIDADDIIGKGSELKDLNRTLEQQMLNYLVKHLTQVVNDHLSAGESE